MERIDCIVEGNKQLAKLLVDYKELDLIKKVKERAIQDNIPPDELSQLVTEMSAYLFRIGTLVSELTAKANENYVYRKLSYMFDYNALSKEMKVKDRESNATMMSKEDYEREVISRYVADYMKTLYDNYCRLISILQSKLALMRSEMNKLNI